MKDMFDRLISVGDYIVYGVGAPSNININIAQVMSVDDKQAKVHVIAGNEQCWKNGNAKYALEKGSYVRTWSPYEGRNVTIRTSRNIMIINGVDALGMHDICVARQHDPHALKKENEG